MTIHEKLERLTRLHKRAALSREAGLHGNYLLQCLRRRSNIPSHAAMALARALGVEPAWLIDDGADWPPVPARQPETANVA